MRLTKKIKNPQYSNDYDILCAHNYHAINKLGKLEDIFELIEEMYKKPVCWKVNNKEIATENYKDSTILYNPKTNEIEIYEYDYGYKFMASYKVEEYGITWWLTKNKGE